MEMRNDEEDYEISDVIARVLHISPIFSHDHDDRAHNVKISTNPNVLKNKLKNDKKMLKAHRKSSCHSRASEHSFRTAKNQEVADFAPADQNPK